MNCKTCGSTISPLLIVREAARINGRKRSEAKARAARANARKRWEKEKERKGEQ